MLDTLINQNLNNNTEILSSENQQKISNIFNNKVLNLIQKQVSTENNIKTQIIKNKKNLLENFFTRENNTQPQTQDVSNSFLELGQKYILPQLERSQINNEYDEIKKKYKNERKKSSIFKSEDLRISNTSSINIKKNDYSPINPSNVDIENKNNILIIQKKLFNESVISNNDKENVEEIANFCFNDIKESSKKISNKNNFIKINNEHIKIISNLNHNINQNFFDNNALIKQLAVQFSFKSNFKKLDFSKYRRVGKNNNSGQIKSNLNNIKKITNLNDNNIDENKENTCINKIQIKYGVLIHNNKKLSKRQKIIKIENNKDNHLCKENGNNLIQFEKLNKITKINRNTSRNKNLKKKSNTSKEKKYRNASKLIESRTTKTELSQRSMTQNNSYKNNNYQNKKIISLIQGYRSQKQIKKYDKNKKSILNGLYKIPILSNSNSISNLFKGNKKAVINTLSNNNLLKFENIICKRDSIDKLKKNFGDGIFFILVSKIKNGYLFKGIYKKEEKDCYKIYGRTNLPVSINCKEVNILIENESKDFISEDIKNINNADIKKTILLIKIDVK